MVSFKDFTALVWVDGQPIAEYEAENEDQSTNNTATRYIEAQSGAKFEIKIEYTGVGRLPGPRSITGVGYRIAVDGVRVRTKHSQSAPFRGSVCQRIRRTGGKRYKSDLIFSELNIVEEASSSSHSLQFQALMDTIRDLGTIEVRILRLLDLKTVDLSTRPRRRPDSSRGGISENAMAIPEKALKGDAKSHYVRFGEESPSFSQGVRSTYYDTTPYVVFKFKYRSRQALEQLHIVPRTTTPETQQADFSNLSRDELLSLVQSQQQQLQAIPEANLKPEPSEYAVATLKRERGADDADDDEIVATESRQVRRCSGPGDWANAAIVDLTAD